MGEFTHTHARHSNWRLQLGVVHTICGDLDSAAEQIFTRSPPPTVYDWRARIKERDLVITDRLEHWLKNLWLQLITCGLRRLWAKSVATARGEKDERAAADYHAVTHHWAQAVRGTILAVTATASATRDLDIRLLRVLSRGLQDPDELPPQLSTAETAYLLFFDGGSRGNPGPGGSGSVIVRLGTQPDIVWAGAMSYAQASTTNNIAEYQGLCTGLKVAEQHGWTPLEVVGDSMLIIRQLSRRQRPKANSLRPLYEQARTTADALRVRGWHHHYRSHNKMADKAANQAMDGGASYQAHAASGRQELDALRVWLHNDVHHWILAQAAAPTPV